MARQRGANKQKKALSSMSKLRLMKRKAKWQKQVKGVGLITTRTKEEKEIIGVVNWVGGMLRVLTKRVSQWVWVRTSLGLHRERER